MEATRNVALGSGRVAEIAVSYDILSDEMGQYLSETRKVTLRKAGRVVTVGEFSRLPKPQNDVVAVIAGHSKIGLRADAAKKIEGALAAADEEAKTRDILSFIADRKQREADADAEYAAYAAHTAGVLRIMNA